MLGTLITNLAIASSIAFGVVTNPNADYAEPSCYDGYIKQEVLYDNYEEPNLKEENSKSSLNPFDVLADGSSNEFTDNGYIDDRSSGANKISYSDGLIVGTLNLYDDVTRKLHNLGERDEDYFTFTLRESCRYYFDVIQMPKNYQIRILKYGSPEEFVCSFDHGNMTFRLKPATYYVHIYTNNSSSITSEQYKIKYYTSVYRGDYPFELTEDNKKNYVGAIWENEIWPSNSKRWQESETVLKHYSKTRRGKKIDTGYVDPVLFTGISATNKTSEEFLDSLLFIWDKDAYTQFLNIVKNVKGKVFSEMTKKSILKAKVKFIEDGLNIAIKFLSNVPVAGEFIELANIFMDTAKVSKSAMCATRFLFFDGLVFEYNRK